MSKASSSALLIIRRRTYLLYSVYIYICVLNHVKTLKTLIINVYVLSSFDVSLEDSVQNTSIKKTP